MRCPVLFALVAAVASCAEPPPPAAAMGHEAYVWQRRWTPAVSEAVSAPIAELSGLRVLAAEVAAGGGSTAWPAVAVDALARSRRPITAVVRIDGSRPIASLSLAPLLERLERWRAAGVEVSGVEIDHDCATAALAGYAGWLERSRPPAPLRLSITALPTWAASPDLARVAAAVDEVVLQVHAVRAPALFDPGDARRWIDGFAAAIGERPMRVALPTYRVTVASAPLAADPFELSRFAGDLARSRPANLLGVVWFRLPVAGDATAWPAATLAAVIGDRPLAPAVTARLVGRGGRRHDVVLENRGTLDGRWPAIALAGQLAAADLVRGYTADPAGPGRFSAPPRTIRAGATIVVGWATGSELKIDAR